LIFYKYPGKLDLVCSKRFIRSPPYKARKMSWKARLVLTLIILLLAVALGLLGAFAGSLLPFYGWLPLIALLGLLLLPWKPAPPAQEDLLLQLRQTAQVFLLFAERQEQISQLLQQIEEEGALDNKRLEKFRLQAEEFMALPPKDAKFLRELLFAEQRRGRAVIPILLVVAAVGGALLSLSFSLSF
jgi:hypothetical protein